MTRINTNVSSLIAQTNLAKTNNQLQQSLTRLSTGLRINSGKDDPAGLIASTMLGSDIVSTQKAIANSQQADQMISTADSALGQVSTLLDTIRGLVDATGNSGAMSADQISANQLQIDSSIAAINQIAQSTKFQGQGLLNGSLDFVTNANTVPSVQNVQVDQATLGSTGQLGVNVNVTKAATQASIQSASGQANATATVNFAPRTTVVFGGGGTLQLNATTIGPQMEGVKVTATNTGTAGASYDATTKTLALTYNATVTTGAGLATLVNALTGTPFSATGDATAISTAGITSGDTLKAPSLKITANTAGTDMNGFTVALQGGAANSAQWNSASKQLTITFDNTADTTLGALTTALNGLSSVSNFFTVTDTPGGAAGADTNTVLYTHSTTQEALEASAVGNSGITGYLHSGFSAATQAMGTLNFAPAVAASLVTSGAGSILDIKSKSLDGSGAGVLVSFVNDTGLTAGQEYASYDATAKTLNVHYSGTNSTVGEVASAINKLDGWTATNEDTTTNADTVNATGQTAVKTVVDQLQIASLNSGANYNNMQISLQATPGLAGGTPVATYDKTKNTMVVQVDTNDTTNADMTTLAAIATAIDGIAGFSANVVTPQNGLGHVYALQADANATANTGNTGGDTLLANAVLQVGGSTGSQSFNFSAGTSVNDIANAINLVSDSTGVTASQSDGLLTFNSAAYGSKQFASVNVSNEGIAGTLKGALSSSRATGTDAKATINGSTAVADGNNLGLNSATLNLGLQVAANQTGAFTFAIQGGGALFQLGPDVVASEQARLGIQGVNATQLGGNDGTLDQLASGQAASVANNVGLAAKIVAEASTAVTTLRGRLGAFQQAALDSNVATLSDTVNSLTNAQSAIQDVDFAAETASLQRAQILSQSGMSVLGIANSQPQNVLTLLRNL